MEIIMTREIKIEPEIQKKFDTVFTKIKKWEATALGGNSPKDRSGYRINQNLVIPEFNPEPSTYIGFSVEANLSRKTGDIRESLIALLTKAKIHFSTSPGANLWAHKLTLFEIPIEQLTEQKLDALSKSLQTPLTPKELDREEEVNYLAAIITRVCGNDLPQAANILKEAIDRSRLPENTRSALSDALGRSVGHAARKGASERG
jgi:hypothetical protein